MNWKKHEGSLLEALSDAGSTPAASTIIKSFTVNDLETSGKNWVGFCTVFCTVAARF